jgi:hypothetical protein
MTIRSLMAVPPRWVCRTSPGLPRGLEATSADRVVPGLTGVCERLTRFFGTLFLINFAMGVVTGIVQEFQFGMNWSNYSVFVGNIFGAPPAMEGSTWPVAGRRTW